MKHYIVIITTLTIFFVGCTGNPTNGNVSSPDDTNNIVQKHTIVTTSFPLYEFARAAAGEHFDVTLLLPPGIEPHEYDPKPSDIVSIQNSVLFVYNGAGMEPWVYDILMGMDASKMKILEAGMYVSVTAEVVGDETGLTDPHIWLDFTNDQLIVNAIATALSEIDPDNAENYTANANAYSEQLNNLDQEYVSSLSNCRVFTFITGGHDAYSYLAKRYDLQYHAVYGLSPNSEPTPQQVKEIIDLTRESDIKYILVEPLLSTRMAETIAEEAGTQTLPFSPAGNLSKEEFDQGLTFIALMKENLVSLTTALECQQN